MLLSIIVPVYNVEKYLRKCVDSLLTQDLPPEEYEIILVDDGSTDQSGTICDEYAAGHPIVKAMHQQNGGLSAARNNGVAVAQGRYVQFVDSDDYLEPNVLKALVEKMETDRLDVLRFNYRNVNERYEVIEPNKDPKRWANYSSEVCDGQTFLNERLGPSCYAWQFMVRRALLTDCLFKEGVYFEDAEWTPRMLLKAKRVTSTGMMVYNYLLRLGSITQSVEEKKKRKLLADKFLLIDSLQKQMESAVDGRWFKGMIAQNVVSIFSFVCTHFYEERKMVVSELKSRKVFPLSTYQSNATAMRKIRMANLSPALLFIMLKWKNK